MDPIDDERAAAEAEHAGSVQRGGGSAEHHAGRPRRVALIELLDRDGRVRRVVDVAAWPLTIGRALDNDVVLDDPHVAAHHARLDVREDGEVEIVVGETRNGVRLGRHRLAAGQQMPLPRAQGPTLLQIGATRARVLRAADVLAPEQAMREEASIPMTFWSLLALVALWAAQQAIAMDPGSKLVDWLGIALGAPVAFVVWCLGWGVASKLFQHRFEFWPHVAVAARGLLVAGLVGVLLPQIAASLGWAWLAVSTEILVPLVLAAMIAAHARLVLPLQTRMVFGTVAVLAVVGITVDMVRNQHRLDRNFDQLYMSTLPMPALRLSRGVAPEAFVEETDALRGALTAKVKESRSEGDGEGDGED